jgi:hypothetical protein
MTMSTPSAHHQPVMVSQEEKGHVETGGGLQEAGAEVAGLLKTTWNCCGLSTAR